MSRHYTCHITHSANRDNTVIDMKKTYFLTGSQMKTNLKSNGQNLERF